MRIEYPPTVDDALNLVIPILDPKLQTEIISLRESQLWTLSKTPIGLWIISALGLRGENNDLIKQISEVENLQSDDPNYDKRLVDYMILQIWRQLKSNQN